MAWLLLHVTRVVNTAGYCNSSLLYTTGNLNELTQALDTECVGKFETRRRVADEVATNVVAKGTI